MSVLALAAVLLIQAEERFTLDNGIQVVLVSTDSKPVLTVGLAFRAGVTRA